MDLSIGTSGLSTHNRRLPCLQHMHVHVYILIISDGVMMSGVSHLPPIKTINWARCVERVGSWGNRL